MPLERARLEVLTADLDGVTHVGDKPMFGTRVTRSRSCATRCTRRFFWALTSFTNAALPTLGGSRSLTCTSRSGTLECETDAAQHAQGAAKRVACHAELGLEVLICEGACAFHPFTFWVCSQTGGQEGARTKGYSERTMLSLTLVRGVPWTVAHTAGHETLIRLAPIP